MSPKFMRELEIQLIVVGTRNETSSSVESLCYLLRECSYYHNCVAYLHQKVAFEMYGVEDGGMPPSGKRYAHLVNILKVVNFLVEEYK